MTLPPHYTSPAKYLEDALFFLKEHQWIYNYPNTHILVEQILTKMPHEWATHFVRNRTADLAPCENDDARPQTLKDFSAQLGKLKPDLEIFREFQEVSFAKNARVGAKKRHEIVRLASLVRKVCDEERLDLVVDVGSGLGYLSQLLSEKFSLRILGVEGRKERVKRALAKSAGGVKYVEHFITGASTGFLEETIERTFPDGGELCIIGLHACADLSVTILDVFLGLKRAKSLVIMPCCYHRLEASSNSDGGFLHFPVSGALRGVSAKLGAEVFLRRPFLRLACQQADARWTNMSRSEREVPAKNCLFRAVLQEVVEEENLKLSRLKRRPGGSVACDVRSLIENFRSSYSLTTADGVQVDGGVIEEKISAKWALHEPNLVLIEALTAFQGAVQSVCENIVLLDRAEYLRENGVKGCRVYKVTDERVSPRCFALVADK